MSKSRKFDKLEVIKVRLATVTPGRGPLGKGRANDTAGFYPTRRRREPPARRPDDSTTNTIRCFETATGSDRGTFIEQQEAGRGPVANVLTSIAALLTLRRDRGGERNLKRC